MMVNNTKKTGIFFSWGLLLLGLVLVILPTKASAATCNPGIILPPCACTGDCHFCDFVLMFVNLGTWFLGIAALFAVYFIVNGAFTMVISSGSPERLQAGKKTLTGALVGLVLVFSAWTIINTLFIAFIGDGGASGQWWTLGAKCPTTPASAVTPEGPTPPPSGGGQCADLPALARRNNVPYPAVESPALRRLRECIEREVPAGYINLGNSYTLDEDHPACNYTRGNPMCEPSIPNHPMTPGYDPNSCSHSYTSCHYGGGAGQNGCEAIDYNAKPPYTDGQLYDKVVEALNGPCRGLAGYHEHEMSPEHVHVSSIDCDHN